MLVVIVFAVVVAILIIGAVVGARRGSEQVTGASAAEVEGQRAAQGSSGSGFFRH